MFGDMMGKLQEMKQKSEEVKNRLDTMSVEADAENGLIKVVCTGNRKITSITIDQSLMADGDKEQLEDLTVLAINRALDKAEKVAEAEMAGIAKGMLPGM
ncbi:MAG: YbaB/EbfC family nucleoid-associated protein [Bacteroidetes bacterium]|nr:MAG: YbaB/EbfC family nucleoid-associated protein [Bacteroidota bacterium]MBL1144243.1 YbaB/EbfC family nucleoid-associated protein [Bacteroidota bacterium]NOG57039.1 YbaB/EbfC family nucleoid-associated protein [Bacteroidota bacterium]